MAGHRSLHCFGETSNVFEELASQYATKTDATGVVGRVSRQTASRQFETLHLDRIII